MGSMGTFDAFTSARLGIYAAQLGLQVTGNNVANINTEGYTRQRIDQLSFKAGAYDKYRSQLDNHVGSGALVHDINQIRDPYLDVRYRNTSPEVGYNDTMLDGLRQIAKILDEVGLGETASDNEKGDGLLYAQIQDLSDKMRAYAKEPTVANNDLVRTSASILCGLFNKYAGKLETLYQETRQDFDAKLTEINECLTNIRDLNRQIRDNEVFGDNALELRDERNRQIDTLSQLIHITVQYTEEDIGCGQTVEKLSIFLDDDNPDKSIRTDESMLVDGVFAAKLYAPEKLPKLNDKYGVADDPLEEYKYLMEDPDNPGAFIGTNDPALAAPGDDNTNLMIQISKLMDYHDKVWSDTTSIEPKQPLEPATVLAYGGQEPECGKFSFTFSSQNWSEGESFVLNGRPITVGKDISVDDANDSEKMLNFIVKQMNSNAKATYRASVDNTGGQLKLVYTAKSYGEVLPENEPSFGVVPPDNGKFTIGPINRENQGKDAKEPTFPGPGDNPSTDPVTGAVTEVTYKLRNGHWYEYSTTTEYSKDVALDYNDLNGKLQAVRELLTKKGEFSTTSDEALDEYATIKRGIPYYQMSLDLLARTFATEFNKLNQGYALDENGNYVTQTGIDADGNPIYEKIDFYDNDPNSTLTYYEDIDGNFVSRNKPGDYAADPTKYREVTVTLNNYMTQSAKDAFTDYFKTQTNPQTGQPYADLDEFLSANAQFMGGVLFSNRNDGDLTDPPITAANISVAHSWATNEKPLIPKFEVLFYDGTEHSTQNFNANHMVNLMEKGLVFNPKLIAGDDCSCSKLFEGNFNAMLDRMNTDLGQDIRATNIALNSAYGQLVEIDTSRDGVSGVDLNDEAMNMVQYQKALNAAMRLMTVVDEALDRLINNTGIAGR